MATTKKTPATKTHLNLLITFVLFLHSRQVSSWEMLLQLLCLLQRHWEEQFSPTNPKWHWQTPGNTQVPLTQPWAHTGSHWPDTLRKRERGKHTLTTQPLEGQWFCLRMKAVKNTCLVHSPVCMCSGSLQADHGSLEWYYSGDVHWHTRPPLGNAGRTSYCSTVGTEAHSRLHSRKTIKF